MSKEEIGDFVSTAHAAGLKVALAGSLKQEHIPVLIELEALNGRAALEGTELTSFIKY